MQCNYFPTWFKQVKFKLNHHLPAILSETCRRLRKGRSVKAAYVESGLVYFGGLLDLTKLLARMASRDDRDFATPVSHQEIQPRVFGFEFRRFNH